MKKNNIRFSNIELLRIIMMLLIVTHHIVVHCIFDQLTYVDSISAMGNGYFCNPVFYPELWLIDIGAMVGGIGDDIFILISGYFLICKDSVSTKKTTIKLLSQCLFAAFVLMIGNTIYHANGYSYNDLFLVGRDNIASSYRFEIFSSSFWYIGFYYCVFLFGTVFWNKILRKLSKQKFIEMLLGMFAVIELSFSRDLINSISEYLTMFIVGVFLYSIGAYIKLYNPFDKIKRVYLIAALVLSVALFCYSTYYTRMFDIEKYIRYSVDSTYIQQVYVPSLYNVLIILNVIAIFELFKRFEIKNNRIINYLGEATLFCYLVHDNELFYALWYKFDWIKALFTDMFGYISIMIMWAVICFFIAVIVYSIYKLLFGIFYRKIDDEN